MSEAVIVLEQAVPPRTPLASLQPLGLGTMYVESFSSYFQRLADEHAVSPKLLAREFVLPRLGFNNRVGEVQTDRYWRSPFFSGMGEVPRQWCQILEELTGVTGLHRLTLLPLHGRVGLSGSSSETHRWCPLCLGESDAAGQPYGQLLWEIGCVQACPRHGIQLVATHGCGPEDAIPPLRIKPLPNLCRQCGRSLALSPPAELAPAAEPDLDFARAVGDLLASPLFLESKEDPDRTIADFLSEMIQSYEGGFGSRAVRRIGASKGQVSDWVHRRHLPGLPHAYMIAQAYGVPLPEVLAGKGGHRPNPQFWGDSPRPTHFRPYRLRTRVADMEAELRRILTLPTPPSEAEAAGMVGTSSRELRNHYPELAHALAERRATWVDQEAARRREERLQVVKAVVDQMVFEGQIPTIARLEERLVGIPKSFLFKERRACKQLCVDAKTDVFSPSSSREKRTPRR